ncbi:hypothetical protein J437_LFUL018495 [Ladona fulva]|uniref:Cytochrome P450 n=1 Tax=Ladona fulva TaxID=123851 RepID=A0A8K0KSW8_LADFU|nr:hypothetical protein J437_LFUL018495 [Ladona fulva]
MIFVDSFGLLEVSILLVTAVALLIYWAFVAPLSYWRSRNVPYIPGVPLFGSLTDALLLKATLGVVYADMYNKIKGKRYCGFLKFNKPGVLIRDPEIIKNVLLRDFNSFHDNDVQVDPKLDPLMARNIFVAAGDDWKRIRGAVSPTFTSGKIKSIYPLIMEVCSELKEYFKENIESSRTKTWEVEMKEMAAQYTTDVVSSSAFGLKSGAIRNPECEFRRVGRKLLEPTPTHALALLIILINPTLANFLRLRFFPKDITDFFRGLVKEVVSRREATGVTRNDFLHLLVQVSKTGKLSLGSTEEESKNAKNVEGNLTQWSPSRLDDVAAQAVGFFSDGFETSSTALGFVMLEMAHNPDIQERLRNEIREYMAKNNGELTYEAVTEMPYMDMVFQETLRKYPPALAITRICNKRYRLPGVDEHSEGGQGTWIEEGMPVVVPVYGLHHDPMHYPNPDKFDPERFSEEGKMSRHRFVHLPIGEGPRICIGIKLGYAQTKAAIATILSNFQVLPSEKTKLPIQIDPNYFLISSKDRLWVKFRKIE